MEDENDDIKEKVSGVVTQLSHDQGDRGALAKAGTIPILMLLFLLEFETNLDFRSLCMILFLSSSFTFQQLEGA